MSETTAARKRGEQVPLAFRVAPAATGTARDTVVHAKLKWTLMEFGGGYCNAGRSFDPAHTVDLVLASEAAGF